MEPSADDLQDVPLRTAARPSSAERAHTYRYFFIELLIVTAGVLIALSVDSLREWNQQRSLVAEARRNIAIELGQNRTDVEKVMASAATRQENLMTALRLATELLTKKKSDVRSISLGADVADLSAAAWHSAQGTGALGHMAYSEVQSLSRVYAVQELFAAHQRQTLGRVATALALMAEGDPHQAATQDLELFRQQVRGLIGDIYIEQQVGKRLIELYTEALTR
jgi:hypothetical protein